MTMPRWSSFLLMATFFAAVAAPWIAPFDPTLPLDVLGLKNHPPSVHHWFGTDPFSRDLLSRTLFGARTTLIVGVCATVVGTCAGVVWAALAFAANPHVGYALLTAADVARSVPRMLLLLIAAAVAGAMHPVLLATVIGTCAAPVMCRLTHAHLQRIASLAFVEAAAASGVSRVRVFRKHVLPNIFAPLVAAGVLLLAEVISMESALSFLGLGVRAPNVSWGSMVQDALPYVDSAWWVAAVPCICVLVVVLSTARTADHLTLRMVRHHA